MVSDSDVDGGAATRIDRRNLLRVGGGAAVGMLAGCPSGDTPTPAGPAGSATPTTAPTERMRGGTLTVGMEGQFTGLDPHRTNSVISWLVVYNTCETLVTFGDGEVVGRLADDWSVSEEGTTYTFTLKQGVQFHPPVSREMTAEDVVYTFERMMTEGSEMASDLAVVESVTAADRYTVQFSLSEPFSPFLRFLARVSWVVVPEEAVEAQGGEIGDLQEPVGTGPFRFADHSKGDSLRVEAFDGYRSETLPLLDAVEFVVVPDRDSRVLALRQGEVDLARGLPGKDAAGVDDRGNTRVVRTDDSAWAQLYINSSREPWSDPAVRRAVAHVVDRSAVVEAGLFGYGTAAWQPFADDSPWQVDLDNARRRDVERAQQILADAGDPLEGETLTIETNSTYQVMETTATVLAANLREAGIDAEVNTVEWGTQLQDFVTSNFDAMAFSIPRKVDPDRYYYNFLREGGYLQYGADQPGAERMRELLEMGRRERGQQRREIYAELQTLVNEHVPWISIARSDGLTGMRERAKGHQQWRLPYDRFWRFWKVEG